MALYIFRAPGQFGDNFVLFQPKISNLVILALGPSAPRRQFPSIPGSNIPPS